MDWHLIVGLLSGIVTMSAGFPYLRDVLRKQTRPNSVCWFGWTLLTGIMTITQLMSHPTWSVIIVIVATLNEAVILGLSFWHGVREYTALDGICLGFGLLAILLLVLTHQPLVSLCLAVLGDAVFLVPTLVKSIRDPGSETAGFFLLNALAGVLSIVSATRYDLANLLFPVYSVIGSSLVGVLIVWGQHQLQDGERAFAADTNAQMMEEETGAQDERLPR